MSDLFIIGAGVSVPYGFPDGGKLLEIIKNLKNYKEEYRAKVIKASFVHNHQRFIQNSDFNQIIDDLNNSPAPSIDDFIRNNNLPKNFGLSKQSSEMPLPKTLLLDQDLRPLMLIGNEGDDFPQVLWNIHIPITPNPK